MAVTSGTLRRFEYLLRRKAAAIKFELPVSNYHLRNIQAQIDISLGLITKTSTLRLVNNKIIDNEPSFLRTMDNLAYWQYYSGRDVQPSTKVKAYVPDETVFFDLLASGSAEARAAAISWRAGQEAETCEALGWFLIMDTMTFDTLDDIEERAVSEWTRYKKSIEHAVLVSTGLPRDTRRCEYAKHICCVEEGEKNGRVHLHCLWFVKNIPNSWKHDPNANLKLATRREITPMKSYWDEGFSTPVAVRTGPDDSWAKLGWRWPLKDGQPLKVSGPKGAGSYISKYLNKERSFQWRIRITRNLGLKQLQQALTQVPARYLRPLSTTPLLPMWCRTGTIPRPLMKTAAKRERFWRASASMTPQRLCRMRIFKPTVNILTHYRNFRRLRQQNGSASAVSSLLVDLTRPGGSFNRNFAACAFFDTLQPPDDPLLNPQPTGLKHGNV